MLLDRPLTPRPAGVLDDRFTARVAVLVAEPLEDAVGRVPLLLRCVLVVGQELVDAQHSKMANDTSQL